MAIEDRKVVTFHYTLRNREGEEIESSRKGEPVTYLHGYRNIVPGLEKAMAGHEAGATFEVTVEPGDGSDEERLERGDGKSLHRNVQPSGLVGVGEGGAMQTEGPDALLVGPGFRRRRSVAAGEDGKEQQEEGGGSHEWGDGLRR